MTNILSFSNYYPFGMLLPNRHQDASEYRYGFQGQEKDDEIKGEGNSVNYKYRMHDPRIGRFFAVDPLTAKYPHYTPYSFSGNEVINAVELEGLEPKYINGELVYVVQAGQGPTQIAEDLNNSVTKEKYGVVLNVVVDWTDIVLNNMEQYTNTNTKDYLDINDDGYKHSNVNEGDILQLKSVSKEQTNFILTNNLTKAESNFESSNEKLSKLESKLSGLESNLGDINERMSNEAKLYKTLSMYDLKKIDGGKVGRIAFGQYQTRRYGSELANLRKGIKEVKSQISLAEKTNNSNAFAVKNAKKWLKYSKDE